MQKILYGDTRIICFEQFGVELTDPWKINLLNINSSSFPMLFGIIPIPRSFTYLDTVKANLTLTDLTSGKNVSIFPSPEIGDINVAVENCKRNSYCTIENVYIGNNPISSIVVKTGKDYWFTLIDSKVMIASELSRFEGINLKKCSFK